MWRFRSQFQQSLRHASTSFRTFPLRLRTRALARHASSSSPVRSMGPAVPANATVGEAVGMRRAKRMLEEHQKMLYKQRAERSRSVVMYSGATIILALGVTYAAVPLYRAFCSATGFTGVPLTSLEKFTPDRLYPTEESAARNRITVHFEATASDELKWKFTPQQRSVKVLPGETALAFYTAENWGDEDVIGIATYNTTPAKMAPYFAKIECFCFEQQKIRAGEEVDLPVFFFIDRDICDDPQLDGVDDVVLSYTFFKARRNKQGHLEPDAPLDVVEKSKGFEDYELAVKA